jgi:hypothetical protein
MPTHRQFSMDQQALTELKTDSSAKPPVDMPPALSDVLAEIGPFPAEALFLGVASDHLPVSRPDADRRRCWFGEDGFPANYRPVRDTDS